MRKSLLIIILFASVIWAYPVKFTYKDPSAENVYLAGDFNNWSPDATSMKKVDKELFEVTLDLAPGKYEYKLVVDGNWITDPENPVTAGDFGNSVIEVSPDGSVGFPMGSNFPGNTLVSFGGDFQSYINYDKNSKWDFSRPVIDIRPILKVSIGKNGKLYTEFRTSNLLEDNNHNIPFKLYRLNYTFANQKVLFRGFYHQPIIRIDNPFHILGYEGEFERKFGDYEQGIFLNLNLLKSNKLSFLISDKIERGRDFYLSDNTQSDRDLLALQYKNKLFNLIWQKRNYLNKYYSMSVPYGSDEDFLYNASDDDWTAELDISLPIGIYVGYLHSEDLIDASEVNKGDGVWEDIDKSWFMKKKDWLILGINKDRISLQLDYERTSIKGKDKSPSYIMPQVNLKLPYFKTNFQLQWAFFDLDSTVSFDNLFYLDSYKNIKYYQYPVLGYKQNVFCSHSSEFAPHSNVKLIWRNAVSSIGLTTVPKMFISELITRWKYSRFETALTFSLHSINDPYFDIKKSYLLKHLVISYSPIKEGKLSLGFGLDPYNLDRDRYAWREFLEDEGLTHSLIENNYMRLGKTLEESLHNLFSYSRIYIKGEVVF